MLTRIKKAHPKSNVGLSTLEFAIILIIIGILAQASYFLYRCYIQKANREVAKITLRQDAALMEANYSKLGSYLTESKWPNGLFTSSIAGVNEEAYTVKLVPTQATPNNMEAFTIMATPIATSIQANDAAGVMCINQTGIITENAINECNTKRPIYWNKDLCVYGHATESAVQNCAQQNCDKKTICGNCSGGDAGGDYNYLGGSCQDAYVGGACSGLCSYSTIDGSCTGSCSYSTIRGACQGDCSYSTVCGSCTGNCTGTNKDNCP